MDQNPLLVILGPTASGKTKLSVSIANTLDAEIISADSRQVFKGMDIGTGKDLIEYHINGKTIPYHLINIREAGENYNVNSFKEDFYSVFTELTHRKKLPILCGGTGMYIHSVLQNHEYTAIPVNMPLRESLPAHDLTALRSLLSGYPPALTAHADFSSGKRMIRAIEIAEYLSHNELISEKRPLIKPLIIGLTSDVEIRRQRILKRLNERFDNGLIQEVEGLLANGVSREMLTFYGLEYKFVTGYLFEEYNLEDLKDKLYIGIRQFAKRQMTFFRKMEKDGIKIHWFNSSRDAEEIKRDIIDLYFSTFNISQG